MAIYPIKVLKDEDGDAFVPLVSADAIVDSSGATLENKLQNKLEASNIIQGDNIIITKSGNNCTIEADLPEGLNVINNLTTTAPNQGVLDAYQGKILKESIPEVINNLDTIDDKKALSAYQGYIIKNALNTKQNKLIAGTNITITEDNVISSSGGGGGEGGTTNYNDLGNKPKINGIVLKGDLNATDLNIKQDYTASDITFTDGETFQDKYNSGELTGPAGQDGTIGHDGATPEIGANGNWYINGVDTNKPSRGEQGQQASVIDNLNSTSSTEALSAKQGKILNDKIPTKTSELNNNSGFITDIPTASETVLGGIKIGNNLTIDADGKLNATNSIAEETDPIFTESPSYNITDDDLENWNGKQEQLVSGVNIKTINHTNILGEGNFNIEIPDNTDVRINNNSITTNGIANINTVGAYNKDTNKIVTNGALEDKIQELIGTVPGAIDYISYSSTETILNPMTNTESEPGVATFGKPNNKLHIKISNDSASIDLNNKTRLFVGYDIDNNVKVYASDYIVNKTIAVGDWLITGQNDGSLIFGGK